MGSIYSNTPPQSELPAQRCSRLDNKKANTPPQSELPTQRCARRDKKRVQKEYKGQIPPRSHNSPPATLRLDRNSEKVDEGRPLVKMSANWEVVGTWSTRTSPMATLSRTKCRSISTCFVHWCWTRLVERYTK